MESPAGPCSDGRGQRQQPRRGEGANAGRGAPPPLIVVWTADACGGASRPIDRARITVQPAVMWAAPPITWAAALGGRAGGWVGGWGLTAGVLGLRGAHLQQAPAHHGALAERGAQAVCLRVPAPRRGVISDLRWSLAAPLIGHAPTDTAAAKSRRVGQNPCTTGCRRRQISLISLTPLGTYSSERMPAPDALIPESAMWRRRRRMLSEPRGRCRPHQL